MDTRSTKFKYSFFTKGVCFLLAVVTFFSFTFFAIRAVGAIAIFGFEEFLGGKYPAFTQSYGFRSQFSEDFYHVRELLNNNADNIDTAFEENKEKIVNTALGSYLDQKAKIIEDELRYAVENYDESYFNYEYTADAVVIPEDSQFEPATETETTTFASSEERMTDANGDEIPRNIEAAQKILKTAKGRDFLNYSALVRDEAFNISEFHYETILTVSENFNTSVHLYNSDFYPDEQAIKKHFLQQYTNIHSNAKGEAEAEAESSRYMLSNLKAFKYYAIDDKGNVYSNLDSKPSPDQLEKNTAYIYHDGKNTVIGKLEEDQKKYIGQVLNDTKNCEIYIYVEDKLLTNGDDAYCHLHTAYNDLLTTKAASLFAYMCLSLIASVILLFVFLCLCGHKNGEEKCVTAYTDKLPTDLHFILSFSCIAGLTILAGWLGIVVIEELNAFADVFLAYIPWIISALLAFSYMFLIEWLASIVRIKKAGQKFFAKMLIAKFIFATGRLLRKAFLSLKNFISAFGYKPKKMQRTVILLAVGYVSGNFIILAVTQIFSLFAYGGISTFFGITACIIYNAVCIYFILQYFRNLDKIIDASCRHESVDFGNEKVPESLNLLASNLTNTNKAMHEAVAKAVRDEQMKTELITNVSHDLKTPLTSLISYSDLLEKCDIKDETALKYIGVINAQSIKLKRLIEDLIEASKVSTGNVTINATKLNLSELAIQAIAEFAPEMEKNGNEIIFSEPEKPPVIFADGSKTYRILSNLLSNAKKYSASDTRVYVSVYTDSINSYFEIKNISGEPLNIPSNELTERFVRGDKSRTREGNGLGLSIAKDLCTLQNGNLHIIIDGDLFKVIVQLPATGEINTNENEEPAEITEE